MLKQYLQNYFAKKFYPTVKRDWYKEKNYKGNNDQERFNNFLESQKLEGLYFILNFSL